MSTLKPSQKPGRIERIGASWKVSSGAVATIAAAFGVLTTLGVIRGSDDAPAPSAAIASAAVKAADSGSSKVLVTIIEKPTGGSAGAGGTTIGAGAFDFRRGRGRVEYDFSRRKGLEDLYSVDVRFDGPTYFVHNSGALRLPVPKSKPWVRVTFADSGNSAALSELGVFDPVQIVTALSRPASGAKLIGKETLRGESMKHYRVERDPDGRGPTLPMTRDVWVDENGFLRRLETVTRTALTTVTSRIEFDGYGTEVDTALPPRNRVFDLKTGR
jgi:hypothetical protein